MAGKDHTLCSGGPPALRSPRKEICRAKDPDAAPKGSDTRRSSSPEMMACVHAAAASMWANFGRFKTPRFRQRPGGIGRWFRGRVSLRSPASADYRGQALRKPLRMHQRQRGSDPAFCVVCGQVGLDVGFAQSPCPRLDSRSIQDRNERIIGTWADQSVKKAPCGFPTPPIGKRASGLWIHGKVVEVGHGQFLGAETLAWIISASVSPVWPLLQHRLLAGCGCTCPAHLR